MLISAVNTVLYFPMKTSLDLPDDLYRRVKSKSALEGKAVREVATALFTAWVDGKVPDGGTDASVTENRPPSPDPGQQWLARWRALGADVTSATAESDGLVDQLNSDRR